MKLIKRLEELWNDLLRKEDIGKENTVTKVLTNLIDRDEDTLLYHEDVYILLKAMIYAAKSDGKIDLKEQKVILEFMGEMSPIEKLFVEQEMNKELNFSEFVKEVPESMRKQVYYISLFAIDLDEDSEREYLVKLADELELEPYVIKEIHESLELSDVA